MRSHTPPTGAALDADALIALNSDLQLTRATVCALALADPGAWAAGRKRGATPTGVSPAQLAVARSALAEAPAAAAHQRALADAADAKVVTLADRDYPSSLHDLSLPPPVLYVRGRVPSEAGISIVGSRKASSYGLDVSAGFAADLAGRGLPVVSGFARGIDTAAHRAAVEAAEGVTVAVLGCGIDFDYPRGRTTLRRAIAQRGALVTEFPCGAPPLPQNFPIRNRLIAALGFGTLVIEATVRSGSLITARLALELGRDIYAVPGRIFDPKAQGPNALIRDGAYLVQHPRDLLITLSDERQQRLASPDDREDDGAAPAPPSRLPAAQRRLLAAMVDGERLSIDALTCASGLDAGEAQSALLELELAGWLRRHPGPAYTRSELW